MPALKRLVASLLVLAGSVTQAYPQPSVDETRPGIVRLLRAREFRRLDQIITSKQGAIQRDVREEWSLVRVLRTFDAGEPELAPLLDAWVEASPRSYPARLARGRHRRAIAFAARGTAWRRDTSDDRIAAMAALLPQVVSDSEAALRANARLAPAYALLIDVARVGKSGVEGCVEVFDRARRHVPASLTMRVAFAQCLLPRWGGSYEALDALAQDSALHVRVNPGLAALAGFAEWDQGDLLFRENRLQEAAVLHTRAIAKGVHPYFLVSRARVLMNLFQHDKALLDLQRVLALIPDHEEALGLRAFSLWMLRQPALAAADVRLLREIDPSNASVKDLEDRQMWEARQSASKGDYAAATKLLTTGLEVTGDRPSLYYLRGTFHREAGNDPAALKDFLDTIRLDPVHYDAHTGADAILIKQQDEDLSVQLWSDYMKHRPGDGRARLARSNAWIRKGDRLRGLADRRAACELGVKDACPGSGR
jgi:tetratricopeptide (TPR) repeat protein